MELTRKFLLGRTVGAVSLHSERDETESLRERETLRDWGKLLDWIVWLLYKIKLLFYTARLGPCTLSFMCTLPPRPPPTCRRRLVGPAPRARESQLQCVGRPLRGPIPPHLPDRES
jgi:hypothetical protein